MVTFLHFLLICCFKVKIMYVFYLLTNVFLGESKADKEIRRNEANDQLERQQNVSER